MWDPRDESASKVYFDSVAQRAMFLFPSSNTDARVLPARTTLCPRVYGERRKWLKSSRTIYVSYVVSSKWKIQRESTVLIKLCLETPLSGVVVDYRIAINVWGGGEKASSSSRDFTFTFETDLANVTTSWKIISIREVNSVFRNDVKLTERILLL